ncbi:Germin-like protein 9-3 [Linum grandiflorum]
MVYSHSSKATFFLLASCLLPMLTMAADPDILTDFILPPNTTTPDPSFFTFTNLRPFFTTGQILAPTNFTAIKATLAEFPALNGQSVSSAYLIFPSGTSNPPHIHPRSSELLFVVQGSLEVGFVDTTNKLYKQTLKVGDMFVFPKGLVHFQYFKKNGGDFAIAVSGYGSANPGTVRIPESLFGGEIDDAVLAKSFKTDVGTIQALKAALKG